MHHALCERSRQSLSAEENPFVEAGAARRTPERLLILLLDRHAHALPWESLPTLTGRPVVRSVARAERITATHLAAERITCLLNPGGDLGGTEGTIRPILARYYAPCAGHGARRITKAAIC